MDIFEAIKNNNIARIKELLDSGIDVNSQNDDGWTPLHEVCENNNIEIVKLLLEQPNIDVNAKDYDGWTPLSIACINHKLENVKELLSHPNINVNAKDYKGKTTLYHACRGGYPKVVVKLLLEHPNIDVNLQDYKGMTPLYVACKSKNIEIAKLLLSIPDIKINFNITEFKNQVKLYLYIKRKQNINLDKVNKILDMIEG